MGQLMQNGNYQPQGGIPLYPFGTMLGPQSLDINVTGGENWVRKNLMGLPALGQGGDLNYQQSQLPIWPSMPPLDAQSYLPTGPSMPPARREAYLPQREGNDTWPFTDLQTDLIGQMAFRAGLPNAGVQPRQSYPIQNMQRPTAEDSQWANDNLRDFAAQQGRTPETVAGLMAAQANAYQMGDHPSQRGLLGQRSMEETMQNAAQRQALGRSTAYWQSPGGMDRGARLIALANQQQRQAEDNVPTGLPILGMGPNVQPGDLEPGRVYEVDSSRGRTNVQNPQGLGIQVTEDGRAQLIPRPGWRRPADQDERMAASRDRRQARRNRLRAARAGYYAAQNSGGVRSTGQSQARQADPTLSGEGQRNIPSLSDFAPPVRADANGNPVPPTPQEQTTAAFRWVDSLIDRNLTDTELLTSFQESGVTAADLRTLIDDSRPSVWAGTTETTNSRARSALLQRALKLIEGGDANNGSLGSATGANRNSQSSTPTLGPSRRLSALQQVMGKM